jgi:hypothetical protein
MATGMDINSINDILDLSEFDLKYLQAYLFEVFTVVL